MGFKSTVRISKLQSKNKMVGSAFNPGGWTIESLNQRDKDFEIEFNNLSQENKIKAINNFRELIDLCMEKGWSHPYYAQFMLKKEQEMKGGFRQNGKKGIERPDL